MRSANRKGYHLLKNYDDLINLGIKCWQYHFEFLNLGYAAYVFFLDFVQKLFPSIPPQRVTQMISGIDVIMYEPDEQLKKLAHARRSSWASTRSSPSAPSGAWSRRR